MESPLISRMKISPFTGGMAQTNAYLCQSTEGNFLIDAPSGVAAWLDSLGVHIDQLYLTHQHYDHVEDAATLQKNGTRILALAPYSTELTLEAFAAGWGLPEVAPFQIDELLTPGETSLFGNKPVTIHHIPGHSPDSITLHLPESKTLFAGDVIFQGSVGRCDLPGGSFEQLLTGIQRDLLPLPEDTKVLPGHGGETTIGSEKSSNPYLR